MIKQVLLTFIAAALTMSGLAAKEYSQIEAGENNIPNLDCVIEPSEIVDVGSAVPGVVEAIHADRSDLVKKGAVVAKLESSVEQASLELAKVRAGVNTAIKLRQQSASLGYLTQKRNQALFKKSAISKQDMDQLKTETRIANLQVRQEKENKRIAGLEAMRAEAILQRRDIKSPVEGVVMERFKSVGEYVEGEPILRVAQLDPLHVEVIVPVEYLGQIVPGMQAEVIATAGASGKHLATVERVDRVADAASGTYGVRLSLPNPDYKIPAGLRCQVGFLPAKDKNPVDLTNRITQVSSAEKDKLLKEKTEAESVKKASLPMEKPTPEPAKIASQSAPASCYTIGPIKTRVLARQLSSKLENLSKNLSLRKESINLDRGFIVFAAQEPGGKSPRSLDTLLGKAGIADRYVIAQGKNKGRVAVGTYLSRQSALKRQKQLAASGFEAEIVPRRKRTTQYWLDVSPKSGSSLKDKLKKVSSSFKPRVTVKPVQCS